MSTTLDYQSSSSAAESNGKLSGTWLGWAIYLGMSWTWCIGMFLPVLLVRDYGLLGWVVFAVPNVIGAAAMGSVIKNGMSGAIVRKHSLAIKAFSFVTATFQIYFALWSFSHLSNPWLAEVILLSLMVFVFTRYRLGTALIIAVIALLVSTSAIVLALRENALSIPPLHTSDGNIPSWSDLLALSLVSSFGFLLCPYLDATFHVAYQKSTAPAKSFIAGFGGFFFIMILFSLGYSRTPHWETLRDGSKLVVPWLGMHWAIQLALTTGLHWGATPTVDELERRLGSQMPMIVGSIALAVLLSFLLPYIHHQKMNSGELIYRCLLGFYGLVFPAYVWLCMLPGRWIAPPTRQQWILLAVAVTVATPMFWMAFIEQKMIWVLPGVTVPLAARFFIRSPVQQ